MLMLKPANVKHNIDPITANIRARGKMLARKLEYMDQQIFDGNRKLDNKFGFVSSAEKPARNEKNEKFIYSVVTSPNIPDVEIISYRPEGGDASQEHRVVFIKRDGELEYYNSTGHGLAELPYTILNAVRKGLKYKIKDSSHRHQEDADICSRHALGRACFKHLSNDEYHSVIQEASSRLGKSPDNVVWSSTQESVEEDLPVGVMKGYKKGGLLRKGERSVAVPIIAHSGELVVPVDTVEDVLNSNAWKKHVKRIASKKKVSISEAYKMSLGL
jgi:hypothetical protein